MRPTRSLWIAAATALLIALGLPSAARAEGYHLPWRAGEAVYVTQDCNDSCCNDHVGHNEYAWDFAVNGSFDVLAPRAGTVVHVKMSSNRGGDASAVDAANYVVIDHGDGTASVMLHLAQGSLDPRVRCGAFVRAGQRLAVTGATGWASGNHLHYQVNRIPPNVTQTCECGPDGMACGQDEAHWDLFWSRDESSTSLPIQFEEWRGASVCGDRHDDNVLVSRNVEDRGTTVVTLEAGEPGRFVAMRGAWGLAAGGVRGLYHQAASNAEAQAMMSFAGRVPTPGLYEIWSALPAAGRNTGVRTARLEVVGRGERARAVQSQSVAGGGYRPIGGRFKLTGRAGEGLLFAADGRPAQSLAVDGVVLHRVGDAGVATAGERCATSAECSGDLVCSAGRCAAGCEISGCGAGSTCDSSGICVAAAGGETAVAVRAPAAAAPTERSMAAPARAVETKESGVRRSPVRTARANQPVGGGSRSERAPVVVASVAPRGALPRTRGGLGALLGLAGLVVVGTGAGLLRRRR